MILRTIGSIFLISALLLTFGCGGGGGGGGGGATAGGGTTSTVVTGTVSKGVVGGAQISVFAITSGVKGAQLGQTVLTDSAGANKGEYRLNIGDYTGPVLVEATGGTYIDEATGAQRDLFGITLRAVVPDASGAVKVAVTPLTEVAAQQMNNDYRTATITAANNAVALLFGVTDIIATQPVDANSGAAATASLAVRNYALALATVSQYMKNGAKPLSVAMADFRGALDPATPAATADQILADLVKARSDAMADPAVNKTGLGAPAASATTATVRVSTSGTLPLGARIGAIGLDIILPAGVTVNADPATTQITAGDLLLSGVADGSQLIAGSFTPASGTAAPGRARIGLVGTAGFGTGEFATIRCSVAAGSRVTASSFILTGLLVTDVTGAAIDGVTAELAVTVQ